MEDYLWLSKKAFELYWEIFTNPHVYIPLTAIYAGIATWLFDMGPEKREVLKVKVNGWVKKVTSFVFSK